MKVETVQKAFDVVYRMIGAYVFDKESSERAGYKVFRSTTDYREYACDLGNRIEVNTKDGRSVNIWIEEAVSEVEMLRRKVDEQALEILRLKAKLYDILNRR